MDPTRFLDDFAVGQRFESPVAALDADAIKAFARQFDPQPFHLDEVAAAASVFRGLAASGWHTAALTMRLIVASDLRPAGGLIGGGIEELRWPRPVRPGDRLRVVAEILGVRASRTKPNQGVVRVRYTTLNDRDEPVQEMTASMIVPRRAP